MQNILDIRSGAALNHGVQGVVTNGFRMVATWFSVAKERQQLKGMTDAQLSDLGVSRADADLEAARPFWALSARR